MADECRHAAEIKDVTPSALGCEECLKSGSEWVHLRLCRTCGHVGCCDDSPNRHATKHFHATRHPIIEGYDPPEGWVVLHRRGLLDLGDRTTPQNGPIPLLLSPRPAQRAQSPKKKPARPGFSAMARSSRLTRTRPIVQLSRRLVLSHHLPLVPDQHHDDRIEDGQQQAERMGV